MPSCRLGFVTIVAVVAGVSLPGSAPGVDFGGSLSAPARAVPVPGYPTGILPQERIVAVDSDKKLSAGDQVTIEIVEDREAGRPRIVTATGELDVPPLGRVRVAGQTATDAAANIKRLLEKDYYYTATVRLSIDQVAAGRVEQGSVIVSGFVRAQGPQVLVVGDALTVAGAILKAVPTEWADLRKVQVTRFNKDGSKEQFQIDVERINKTGDAASDPVLQDGDRIHVPNRRIRF